MCPEHYKVWEQRHVWYACEVLKHYICNTARWAWGFSSLQTVKTVSSILKISHFLSRYLLHLKAGRWRPHTCTQTHWIWGPHLFLRTTTSGWTPRGWCKLMVSPLRRNTHTVSINMSTESVIFLHQCWLQSSGFLGFFPTCKCWGTVQ